MKDRYVQTYGASYEPPSPREPELLRLFHEKCEALSLWHSNDQIFRYLNTLEEKTEQLSIFDTEWKL